MRVSADEHGRMFPVTAQHAAHGVAEAQHEVRVMGDWPTVPRMPSVPKNLRLIEQLSLRSDWGRHCR